MTVMKFGGTSVQDAAALTQVGNIVSGFVKGARSVTPQAVVVLSATSGTTDDLLKLAHAAGNGKSDDVHHLRTAIRSRHYTICAELGITDLDPVNELCNDIDAYTDAMLILHECTHESLDAMASFGERLSTTIFAQHCTRSGLRCSWLDARSVVRTDDTFVSAAVDFTATGVLCRETFSSLFKTCDVVVTQGFVGSTADGRTTTLGRGGSDYTAAILGAAINAAEIRIYTDVSGVYTTDPRITSSARPIPQLSFDEVRELALYGAKVLHPDTIAPAIEKDIPVRVLNTFKPGDPGTVITHTHVPDSDVHAIALLTSCRYAEFVNSSAPEISVPVVLRMSSMEHDAVVVRVTNAQEELSLDVALSDVAHRTSRVCVIALCGTAPGTPAVLERIASGLRNLTVHAIVAGASPVATFVLCSEDTSRQAVAQLHDALFAPASISL